MIASPEGPGSVSDKIAPPRENLIELDCLRGVAILLVFLYHADGMFTPDLTTGGLEMSAVRALVGGGQTGVSLFFILSAFCLSLPMFREQGARRFRAPEFFRRRALRILPMYWTTVIVAALLTGTAPSVAAVYLVFGHSIDSLVPPISDISGVWWSLATEVQFYLLLPLLPVALRSTPGRRIGLAALAAYLVSYAFYAAGSFPLGSTSAEISVSHSVFGRGPLFLFGIGSAWIYAKFGRGVSAWARERPALRLGGSDAILAGCVFALGNLLAWNVWIGTFGSQLPPWVGSTVGEGLLWSMIVLGLLLLPLRSRRLFVNPPLAAIGRWSYSIYLLHIAVQQWVVLPLREPWSPRFMSWDLKTGVVVIGAAALTVTLSAITYQLIEKPFLRRKDRQGDPADARGFSREPA